MKLFNWYMVLVVWFDCMCLLLSLLFQPFYYWFQIDKLTSNNCGDAILALSSSGLFKFWKWVVGNDHLIRKVHVALRAACLHPFDILDSHDLTSVILLYAGNYKGRATNLFGQYWYKAEGTCTFCLFFFSLSKNDVCCICVGSREAGVAV